jgi:hypothetical protein
LVDYVKDEGREEENCIARPDSKKSRTWTFLKEFERASSVAAENSRVKRAGARRQKLVLAGAGVAGELLAAIIESTVMVEAYSGSSGF